MKLWVIRHGKSSLAETGQRDFDRPLAERGRSDGARVEQWLSSQHDLPELLLVSDACRTQQTAAFIRRGTGLDQLAEYLEHRLYLADPETLLDVVRSAPIGVESIGLIGHNPSCTQFVNLMAGESVISHMPTLGVALLDISSEPTESFNSLAFGQAELDLFITPRMLKSS